MSHVLLLFHAVDAKGSHWQNLELFQWGFSSTTGKLATTRLEECVIGAEAEWFGWSPLGWAIYNGKQEAVKYLMKLEGLDLHHSCSPGARTPLGLAASLFMREKLPQAVLTALVAEHPLYRDVAVVKKQLETDKVVFSIESSCLSELMKMECTNPVVLQQLLELQVSRGFPIEDGELSRDSTRRLMSMENPGLDSLVMYLVSIGVRVPLEVPVWEEDVWGRLSDSCAKSIVLSNASDIGRLFLSCLYVGGKTRPKVVNTTLLAVGGTLARDHFLYHLTYKWDPELFEEIRESGPVLVDAGTWRRVACTENLEVAEMYFGAYGEQISATVGASMVLEAVDNRNLPMLKKLVEERGLEVNYRVVPPMLRSRSRDEGSRPLDKALKLGWKEGVEVLERVGAVTEEAWRAGAPKELVCEDDWSDGEEDKNEDNDSIISSDSESSSCSSDGEDSHQED